MEATEEKTRVEGQARACEERLGLAERYRRAGEYESLESVDRSNPERHARKGQRR